jgi:hypothetical protein
MAIELHRIEDGYLRVPTFAESLHQQLPNPAG